MSYVKEIAICGIVVIVCVALYSGVNGVLLASAIGGIAGIAGYEIGQNANHNKLKKRRIRAESPLSSAA